MRKGDFKSKPQTIIADINIEKTDNLLVDNKDKAAANRKRIKGDNKYGQGL